MSELALLGGPKVKTTPFGTGKRFGAEELRELREALEQNTLFYWSGKKVKAFAAKFAAMYGMRRCVAVSSGTAALHTALGALGIAPGDEVITSPITDMGTLIGILYQSAVPVFADLDPHTYNMTAETVAARITPKTKAVIVVHLAGNAADMDPILALARRHGIRVVEDCAQSYLCYDKGRLAGTLGDIGCFSLNDFKHISAGDGGMLIMNDEDLYYKAFRFADKNYDRFTKDPAALRRIEYLAPNYRMNELTGAVGLAQLDRLAGICAARSRYGDELTRRIRGLPGIDPPAVPEGNKSSYWFYMFRVNEKAAGVSRDEFSRALGAEGIPNSPGYIPACVYEYDLFQNRSAFPGSAIPFSIGHEKGETRYGKGLCPVAEEILRTSIRVCISEFHTEQDMRETADAIVKVSEYYAKKR